MRHKIRFGIIGTGNISGWFLEGARIDPRFEATAIYSRTLQRGREFASTHNIPRIFTSLEEMAQAPDIDAVYIASPNHIHASQAIACMTHGKHVLCEKPMASNAAEARKMIDTANANGVLLMEAMIATLNPNFAIAMRHIAGLGKIRRYVSSYCQYSSRYDSLKAGQLPNVFNPTYSAGALMDIGIYTVYPMVALFGKPESIVAEGLILDSGVDAQGTINCRYNGMEATLIYSKIANSYLPTEIEGEKGNLILEDIHNLRTVTHVPRPVASSGRDTSLTKIDIGNPDIKDLYYYETREFIDLLESGAHESAINSHENSLITLEILDETRRQLGIRFPADHH